ncbi:plasmid replication initiator TrfA [Ralstonia sp. ASV6]|uniref:plasmid replication initiator TrfA n=1 Tax=Ralstonia sp. ASV6 TaxID=2795124 RepID=UPI0018EDE587|nr:plasmid replication initiator TrfA [Ralstonia sp. ASV6]
MTTSSHDIVEVDGVQHPLSREEHEALIAQTAHEMGCSRDEAWEQVKVHVAALLADKPGRKGRSKAPADPEPSTALVVSRPKASNSVAEPPYLDVVEGGRYILHLNGSPLSSAASLLPDEIADLCSGSIVEAIHKGLITLPSEHEDVALLRAAAPKVFGLGPITPARQAAIAAIQQKQYKFPFHESNTRIMPTDLNKTSLFHVASNNTPRRYCRDEPLGRIGDSVFVTYRGEELRHDDELVFMQLLHMARGRYPNEVISVRNVPFFRGSRGISKRVLSSNDTNSVEESLSRMRGAYLTVQTRSCAFTVNLIADKGRVDSDTLIGIDPVMVILYQSFTAMDTDHLFQTTGIARQLLKFICTIPYAQTYPIKVLSLFELCYGTLEALERHYREKNPEKTDPKVRIAMSKKVSDFRRKNLPAALDSLKSVGAIVGYEIDEDDEKVVIFRDPATVSGPLTAVPQA